MSSDDPHKLCFLSNFVSYFLEQKMHTSKLHKPVDAWSQQKIWFRFHWDFWHHQKVWKNSKTRLFFAKGTNLLLSSFGHSPSIMYWPIFQPMTTAAICKTGRKSIPTCPRMGHQICLGNSVMMKESKARRYMPLWSVRRRRRRRRSTRSNNNNLSFKSLPHL